MRRGWGLECPNASRFGLVSRRRLLERVSAELARADAARTLFVEAPAGYGKSAFLAQLHQVLGAEGWVCAWASASAWGGSAPESFLAMIDDIVDGDQRPEPTVLFIDDAHLIADKRTLAAVMRFVERAPVGYFLVLAARPSHRFKLARACLDGAVLRLGREEIAFDEGEAGELLEAFVKAPLGSDVVRDLVERTAGWPALLHFVGRGLRAGAAVVTGEDPDCARYLQEEVIDPLPPDCRELLLMVSPVDEFSADLGARISGRKNVRALLKRLDEGQNLILAEDRLRQWFRIPEMMREYLVARLEIETPGAGARALAAASLWHEEEGQIEKAVEYALRMGDFERAAACASQHVADLALRRGEIALAQHWVANLPKETLDRHPALKMGLAWAFVFRHRHAEADVLLDSVEAAMRQIPNDPRAKATLSTCFVIRAISVAASDHQLSAERMLRHFERASVNAGPVEQALGLTASAYCALSLGHRREATRLADIADELIARSDSRYAQGWNVVVRARLALFDGRPADAVALVEAALARLGHAVQHQMRGGANMPDLFVRELLSICLAEGYYLLGQLDQSRAALDAAGETAYGHITVELGEIASGVQARLALAKGDGEAAVAGLRCALKVAAGFNLPRLVDVLGGELATTLIRLGRNDEAFAVDDEFGLSAPLQDAWPATIHGRQLTQARLALARGNPGRCTRLIGGVLSRVRATGAVRLEIAALCVGAAAAAQLGDLDESHRLVAHARLTAEIGGMSRVFQDEAHLLSGIDSAAGGAAVRPAFASPRGQSGRGKLSHRETHVIGLISQGLTNRNVAQALYLSEDTVKWHLRNIVKKLQAKNRTHAVQIARELGLLH